MASKKAKNQQRKHKHQSPFTPRGEQASGADRAESAQPEHTTKYVLFADVLGFSSLVRRYRHAGLRMIYEHAIRQAALTSVIGGSARASDGMPAVNVRLISDSVILWTDGDSQQEFLYMLSTSRYLLNASLTNGTPMRAALTWGDAEHWAERSGDDRYAIESLFGLAFVGAYEAEHTQQWSGGIILPQAIARFDELGERDGTVKFDGIPNQALLAIKYPVPFKRGDEDCYALNWLAVRIPHIDANEVTAAFKKFHEDHADESSAKDKSVEQKLANTIRFVEHVTSLALSI